MVQNKAALVLTGAIKGTPRDRLYQELVLESLADGPIGFFSSIILYEDSYHFTFKLTIILLVKERI